VHVTPVGNAITTNFARLQALKMKIARDADAAATGRFHSARTQALLLLLAAPAAGAAVAFAITRGVRRTACAILARLTSLREQDTRQLQDGLARLADVA
jgi:hypothetical protein